jgi:predicted nuclease of predicted toxin-antitoxin system
MTARLLSFDHRRWRVFVCGVAMARSAWDEQLIGRPDVDVLERAASQGRVVVTHDVAFGRSAIRAGAAFIGIVYLRPGQ